MRGLAWDDKPEEMEKIRKALHSFGIELTIEQEEDEFARRLLTETWDFVVTDLLDERSPTTDIRDAAGIRNALAASRVGLVFIITGYLGEVDLRHLRLPDNVILKSKDLNSMWLAGEIHDTLKERDIYVDHKKVFLIYGRDRNANGMSAYAEAHMKSLGLEVVKGDPINFGTTIPQGLLELMRPCAAFVAICTPDDVWKNTTHVPRGNVLYEMGIAVGLTRGLERLIILQRWGPNPEDQASLPSDFGAQVTVRFMNNQEDAFAVLEERLKKLRLQITKP